MTEQEKQDLINHYLEAYNSLDVEEMMITIHPEIEFENVSDGEVNATAFGIDEFCRMAKQSQKLFASRQQTVTAFHETGDGASIEIAYRGVLALDLPNGMKAGEVLNLKGRSEFEFKDGKIFRIVDYS